MSAEKLLTTSSNFWKDNFEDYDIVLALVRGMYSSASESYRTLSAACISRSIEQVPLTIRRQQFPLEVSRQNLRLDAVMPMAEMGQVLYRVMELPDNLVDMPIIVSGDPENPSEVYERGVDYEVYRGDDPEFTGLYMGLDRSWIKTSSKYVAFLFDPLASPGAHLDSHIVRDYYRIEILDSSATLDEFAQGTEVTCFSSTETAFSKVVAAEETDGRIFVFTDPVSPLPAGADNVNVTSSGTTYGCAVSLFDMQVKRSLLWALNAKEDPRYLYSLFGYRYFNDSHPSTEYLRKVIRGLTLLRTAPITESTIKSAVSLVFGLPVFEAHEEVGDYVDRVTAEPGSAIRRVDTILATYLADSSLTLRDKVINATEDTVFTFLEPLIDGITVLTSEDEDWWYDNEISFYLPELVAPGLEDELDRKLIQGTHLNVIGSPTPNVIPEQRVGDYHLQIGEPNRTVLATSLMEDFLKWKFIGLTVSDEILALERVSEYKAMLVKELQESLPVGTLLLHNLG